jgi:hypothetical protein
MATVLLWHLRDWHHNTKILWAATPLKMAIYKHVLLCEDSTPLSRESCCPFRP